MRRSSPLPPKATPTGGRQSHRGHLRPRDAGDRPPPVGIVPLQLLACHIAVSRGYDADKPRSLAKSVTVE